VVRSDPAATAANILGAETLFRLGFAADLVGVVLLIASVLTLHELFRPVSRRLASLMACFGVVGAAIQSLDCLGDILALLMLKGELIAGAFTTTQSQALAYQFLRLHMLIYDVAFVFYGVFAILIGRLVLRSAFLPRVLGVLMTIDGLGYITFALITFISPPFTAHLYPVVPFVTAVLGEGSLMLWLTAKTVDARRWEEQAAEAAA
jgi:hypothetical protein